mmetsp:Transcript_5020/g.12500  ORF Transcript_5020/g.12500 Transcript_5020/m.12500 type:complete len:239 (-) Transcript_5020:1335-2051(-)
MQPIRQGGRRGFFHNAGHLDSGQGKRPRRLLSLIGVEFGGNANDGRLDIVVSQKVPRELHQIIHHIATHLFGWNGSFAIGDAKGHGSVIIIFFVIMTVVVLFQNLKLHLVLQFRNGRIAGRTSQDSFGIVQGMVGMRINASFGSLSHHHCRGMRIQEGRCLALGADGSFVGFQKGNDRWDNGRVGTLVKNAINDSHTLGRCLNANDTVGGSQVNTGHAGSATESHFGHEAATQDGQTK